MIECRPTTEDKRALEIVSVILRRAAAPPAAPSIRSTKPCARSLHIRSRHLSYARPKSGGRKDRRCRMIRLRLPLRRMIPLSILDLSPVAAGSTGAQALRNSLDLARLADDLGFTRYWVAEHHNMPAIASSAPDIMIGQIAAVTRRMRIGSGGVMLPNHAPLMVAERFKVLEALLSRPHRSRPRPRARHRPGHVLCAAPPPGHQRGGRFPRALQRIDAAGNARLSGRSSVSQCARHAGGRAAAADLSARLVRLQRAARRPYRRGVCLRASLRRLSTRPRRCGSIATISSRRASHDKPYAILGTACDLRRHRRGSRALAKTVDLNIVRRAKGEYLPLASPEDAAAYDYTPVDRARIAQNRTRCRSARRPR